MADRPLILGAGLLVVLGLVAGLASVAPAIDSADYMIAAPAAAIQVKLAAVAQLVMALAYLGFAAIFYPVLLRHGAEFAVVFLGARFVAVALSIVSIAVMLSLLSLAQEGKALAAADRAVVYALGDVLKLTRDQVNHVFMIVVFGGGNAMFYLLAFRARVLPRWLAMWGVVGVLFAVAASGLFFFGAFEVVTVNYLALNLPAVSSEFLLAIWLITKGFRADARSTRWRVGSMDPTGKNHR